VRLRKTIEIIETTGLTISQFGICVSGLDLSARIHTGSPKCCPGGAAGDANLASLTSQWSLKALMLQQRKISDMAAMSCAMPASIHQW